MDLYVGGLAPEISEGRLRRIFSAIGQVTSVRLIIDRQSGQSKGSAVVDMPEDMARTAIAALDGKSLGGQVISVSSHRLKSKPSSGSSS